MTEGLTVTSEERVYPDTWNAISQYGRRSIKTGCLVSKQTNFDVQVNGGTVVFGSSEITVSTTTLTHSNPDTILSRFDNIVVTNTGQPIIIEGTASENPIPPIFDPDDYLVLSRNNLRPGSAELTTSDIKDMRVLLENAAFITDTTKVLKSGDTMTGALTTPITIVEKELRVGEVLAGDPEIVTSQVVVLDVITSSVSTGSFTLSTTDYYVAELRIRNTGKNNAYFDVNSGTATTNSSEMSLIPSNDEIIITDTEFKNFSGASANNTSRIEFIGLIAQANPNNSYSNTRELLRLSDNGSYNGSFSSLTNERDILIVPIGTTDVYINFSSTADTSDIRLTLNNTFALSNSRFDTFYIYSTVTSEVRILGIGRD